MLLYYAFLFICFISSVSSQFAGFINDIRAAWTGIIDPFVSDHAAAVNFVRDVHESNSTSLTSSPRGQCLLISDPFFVRNATRSGPNVEGTPVTKGGQPTSAGASSATPSASLAPSVWKIQKQHMGDTFFDDWVFFVGADPTHGVVQYLDQPTALSSNLTSINGDGHAIMKVNTTQTISGNRPSVRITTNYQFTGGLLVLDAVHAPTGCATWPAFWTNGDNWPNNGEIDIMEGVNDLTVNQASIHTAPGCHISDSEAANNATGTLVGGSDCASAESNNGGCGQQATSLSNTYGPPFNSNNGGVYAMLWDESGITVHFFQRQQIPDDILSQLPQPQNWGLPFASWPATSCNPFQFFQQHSIIFDITLCGDWAGNVWGNSGPPGQETSCAQRTGFSTCADFVQNVGSAFEDAYWEIRSVTLYQKDV